MDSAQIRKRRRTAIEMQSDNVVAYLAKVRDGGRTTPLSLDECRVGLGFDKRMLAAVLPQINAHPRVRYDEANQTLVYVPKLGGVRDFDGLVARVQSLPGGVPSEMLAYAYPHIDADLMREAEKPMAQQQLVSIDNVVFANPRFGCERAAASEALQKWWRALRAPPAPDRAVFEVIRSATFASRGDGKAVAKLCNDLCRQEHELSAAREFLKSVEHKRAVHERGIRRTIRESKEYDYLRDDPRYAFMFAAEPALPIRPLPSSFPPRAHASSRRR